MQNIQNMQPCVVQGVEGAGQPPRVQRVRPNANA